jgi:hypothetical protein
MLVVVAGRNYQGPVENSDYMAAIIDKHALLQNTIPPRIILIGGSNLAFGIDSKRIEDSIRLPVINLGLHGGLGLNFILNEAKLSAKPGDNVIISIEYFLLLEGIYGLQKNTAKYYPEANKYFSHNYYIDLNSFLYEELPKNLQNNILQLVGQKLTIKPHSDTSAVYSRGSFNVNGDMIRHLTQRLPEELRDRKKFIYEKWEGINILNEFAEYAEINKIKVYFIFPNYPESEFKLNRNVFYRYASDLKEELNIKILNKPEDFVFADSLFYDSVYHLNKRGREKRTTLLIELLKLNLQPIAGNYPSRPIKLARPELQESEQSSWQQ